VWGMRYVDDLVLRGRDADGNSGTGDLGVSGSGLEERLYALTDALYKVVSVKVRTIVFGFVLGDGRKGFPSPLGEKPQSFRSLAGCRSR